MLAGVGIGLRRSFARELLQSKRHVDWLEVVPENYLNREGPAFATLMKCRERWPIVLHGVSLSICGAATMDPYLEALGKLCASVEPIMVSDHLCIADVHGEPVFDLIPPPFNDAFADHAIARIQKVTQALDRPVLLENITRYVTMPGSTMEEGAFISRILRATHTGLLLDVNNLYINAVNHNVPAELLLESLPLEHVRQIHLGGHVHDGRRLLDTHSRAIAKPVWDLFHAALARTGPVPVLMEWDQDIPSLHAVLDEADHAREVVASVSSHARERLAKHG